MFFEKKGLRKATKEDEQRFSEAMQENKVGFMDAVAMVLSAFFVIVVPCLLVLLGLSGLVMLLFGAFR